MSKLMKYFSEGKLCVEISVTRIRFQVFPVVAERPSLLTSNSTEHINGQNILSWDKNMDFPWNELKNIGDAKGNTQGSYQSMCVKSIPIGSSHFGSIILLHRPFYSSFQGYLTRLYLAHSV